MNKNFDNISNIFSALNEKYGLKLDSYIEDKKSMRGLVVTFKKYNSNISFELIRDRSQYYIQFYDMKRDKEKYDLIEIINFIIKTDDEISYNYYQNENDIEKKEKKQIIFLSKLLEKYYLEIIRILSDTQKTNELDLYVSKSLEKTIFEMNKIYYDKKNQILHGICYIPDYSEFEIRITDTIDWFSSQRQTRELIKNFKILKLDLINYLRNNEKLIKAWLRYSWGRRGGKFYFDEKNSFYISGQVGSFFSKSKVFIKTREAEVACADFINREFKLKLK